MRSSFIRFITSLDDFGHTFQLTYKGEEHFQTRLGGTCSLIVKATTFILFIVYIKSMLLMEDPDISSFARPLTKDEKRQ